MVLTLAAEGKARAGLRPMDPARDLRAIADLIAQGFAHDLDSRARAALRDMRWMARLSPFVWWWAQADPEFRDTFHGFVWEEPDASQKRSLIVGNVSLNRAPGRRERWIICNVAVRPEYRRQGIARQLTLAALAEVRESGAEGALLQVYRDNLPALRLYSELGFQQVAGESTLRLEAGEPVSVTDAPGYSTRRLRPADGQAAYELTRLATPSAHQWLEPIRAAQYRPDALSRLGAWMGDRLAGRRPFHLGAWQGTRLVALQALTVSSGASGHQLRLLVHPEHRGKVETALISQALHRLARAPARPVWARLDTSHSAALELLQASGFVEQATLLTMRKDWP